ncbi:hypothetical protein CEXT_72811 [Caerostris extrusa]|uniref:Uncharacterized protein n=1 Tax=Caerostris extrusa TaxID=172846 RepID=A0AAV4TR33_CAEEX|nr:hypothetical protein CEXT_72811 [Caerostris extrusa]
MVLFRKFRKQEDQKGFMDQDELSENVVGTIEMPKHKQSKGLSRAQLPLLQEHVQAIPYSLAQFYWISHQFRNKVQPGVAIVDMVSNRTNMVSLFYS